MMKNETFRDIRRYKGMTMQQFADWIGVSLATVSMIEGDHRDVSDFVSAKIARKFEATNEFREYQRRRKTLLG